MSVYKSTVNVPSIEIENDMLWEWFERKCKVNHEIAFENGYLVRIADIQTEYVGSFKSYIEFELEGKHELIKMKNLLKKVAYIIDQYKESDSIIYVIGF